MIYIMMYDTFMDRTQIYLPHQTIVDFRQRAFEEGVSVSEIIRRTIINCEPKKKLKKNAGEILLALARLGERNKVKAPKDLASNIDKYLYGQ